MSYDPTREWTIAAADLTLLNDNFHWLYAKVPIDDLETAATIIASESHIDALPEDGYIYYKIGFASPVSGGVRELHVLWGVSRPVLPGTGYNWKLHSPEEIIGYLAAPSGLAVNVDGTGAIIESVAAGQLKVTAINANGETTASDVPAFDVLADSTQAMVSWTAVTGATGYRVYNTSTGYYKEITGTGFNYIGFVFDTLGAPPTTNTAAIYQTAFTIDNGDTVQFTGEGVDVETSVDPLDSTKKVVHLTADVNTDEKVKFDAGDTAAGYLAEKIVSGANIAISEGTGADENKLKIAVTGLAAVATSGSYNDLTDKPTIPASADLPFQSLTAKDITPGTAQEYTLIPRCREGLTIDSFVYLTDDGTLTGCAVKIGSTAVTGLSSLSVGTTQAETNATGANTTAAGDKIIFSTSTGYTGAPTMIEIQLNFHKT